MGDIRGMHGESLQELLAKNVDKYFEAFMTTYHPAMMRYVQSRFHANFPDDEEAVEEAFVRVYRRFMGLNEQEILRLHIEPYLRETVHNCFLSQQDKKLRGSNEFSLELIEEQGFELAETQHIDGPEIAYLKQERQRELILLLQNLKPVISGNIIYARYFLGFSIKKLSFTFGLSENTINSILRRSLRKLREIKEIRQMKEMR